MKTASPFRLLREDAATVRVTWKGQPLDLPDGMTLAAALLAAGATPFRTTPVSGAPRAPWCMMGACYECLVTVNGETVQACMTAVRAGMAIAPLHGGTDLDGGNQHG